MWAGRIEHAWGLPLRSEPSFATCWPRHNTFGEFHGTSSDQMSFPFDQPISFAYAGRLVGPFAPFGVPVWNPFLNLRGISFIVRILPVPVVFLRLAFMPQLSVTISYVSPPLAKPYGCLDLIRKTLASTTIRTLTDLGRRVAA